LGIGQASRAREDLDDQNQPPRPPGAGVAPHLPPRSPRGTGLGDYRDSSPSGCIVSSGIPRTLIPRVSAITRPRTCSSRARRRLASGSGRSSPRARGQRCRESGEDGRGLRPVGLWAPIAAAHGRATGRSAGRERDDEGAARRLETPHLRPAPVPPAKARSRGALDATLLDVASMSREQRDALRRELLRQHPHLAQELADAIRSVD
jgi:hypothetical protein